MGNSCFSVLSMPAIIKAQKSCKPSNVMHNIINIAVVVAGESTSRMVEVKVPPPQTRLKVAELLLEFPPGHFIACFSRSYFVRPAAVDNIDKAHNPDVRPAARISALTADADVVPGEAHVYVLFPMSRLHTRMTPQERLTFAQILHKDISAPEAGFVVAAEHHSCNKPFSSAWRLIRRRGARVAPILQVPNYHSMQVMDANESSAAHEQGSNMIMMPRAVVFLQQVQGTSSINADDQMQSHQMMQMSKPKPWVPTLEAICEEQECQ